MLSVRGMGIPPHFEPVIKGSMRKTAPPNPGTILGGTGRMVKDGSIFPGKPPDKISTLLLDNATSLAQIKRERP
jgi:hypothetical protein